MEALKYNSTLITFRAHCWTNYNIDTDDVRTYNPKINLHLGWKTSLCTIKNPDKLTKISAIQYVNTHQKLPPKEIIPDGVASILEESSDQLGLVRSFK